MALNSDTSRVTISSPMGANPEVRAWNVYTQQWEVRYVKDISDEMMASLPESQRARIRKVQANRRG